MMTKYWHEFNCPGKQSCTFASIGQHLLNHAVQHNRHLLTVQIGAMDGISNDPMYDMFVRMQGSGFVRGLETPLDLRNWLPVLIEPVPTNYENLITTYTDIASAKGLGCAVPINAAVSYGSSAKTCPFCRMNTAEDAPKECKDHPDWMKLQIGTLDCEHSKRFFANNFDLCILQDPLPCSSVVSLITQKLLTSRPDIAMLQIDVEGYEYILLDGFLSEVQDISLPPVVHFEHKVMKDQDRTNPLDGKSRLNGTIELLQSRGYILYDEGEDFLAIRL